METSSVSPLLCPHCSSSKVVGFGGIKGQEITDVPKDGQPTVITIDRKRYRCNDCRKTFLERLDYVDANRSITKRLVSYIEEESLSRPFLEIAKETGLAESTIRKLFSECTSRADTALPLIAPKRIAIDEIFIVNKPRLLVSNLDEATIIDIIDANDLAMVSRQLGRLQNRKPFKFILMCGYPSVRMIVKNAFQNSAIGFENEYLVCRIMNLLESMRQSLRKSLTPKERRLLNNDREILSKRHSELTDEQRERLRSWQKPFKKLFLAYWSKERFIDVIAMTGSDEFFNEFLNWQRDVYADCIKEYEPLVDFVHDWEGPVLTRLYCHAFPPERFAIIQEFSEALKGIGRGHSFKAVRTKILSYKEASTKYGLSIPTITKLLKAENAGNAGS